MEKRVIMANTPQLIRYLRDELSYEFSNGLVELHKIRNLVSSPRLFDVYVRGAPIELLVEAGSTFLDRHAMLADRYQKTYAISIDKWEQTRYCVDIITEFKPQHRTISNIQVWPYEPSSLNYEQLRIAVALSFTRAAFLYESRISSALNEILSASGIIVDEPLY
jgi:hypothetical protein